MSTLGSLGLKQALEYLRKINEIRFGSPPKPIHELSILGRFNAWQFFQQSLLFGELTKTPGLKKRPSFHLIPLKFGLVVVSFFGILFLLVSRRKVLIYTIDRVSSSEGKHDFRMDGIYAHLKRNRIPYVELVHTSPAGWFRNLLKRRRPAIFLQAFDAARILSALATKPNETLATQDFEGPPKERAFALVRYFFERARIAEFRVRCLRRILRASGVRVLLTIDDTRHYNELLIACRLEKIPSIAFQHGHFTKYHVGWLKKWETAFERVVPDQFVVWSSYWKEELGKLGSYFPSDRIKVGGKPYGDTSQHSQAKKDPSFLTVLIPYEKEADKEALAQFVLSCQALENVQIVFKIRPDMSRELQLKEYGLENNSRLIAGSNLTVLPHPDLVVGTYSTFLYEMVERAIPVAILKTEQDFGEGLLRNGLAELLELEGISRDRLEALAYTPEDVLRARKNRLVGAEPLDFSNTLKGILDPLLGEEGQLAAAINRPAREVIP